MIGKTLPLMARGSADTTATARLESGTSRKLSPFLVGAPSTPRRRAVCRLRSMSGQVREASSDCRAAVSMANSTIARGNLLLHSVRDPLSSSHSPGSSRRSRAFATAGLRTSAVGMPCGNAIPQSMAQALKIRESMFSSCTTV